jgi:zinc-binding alcohol dehydrogenase/oxidoreductase
MKAAVIRELGGPGVLRVEEVPDPVPAAGEVVVRLRYAALNYHDVLLRRSGLGMQLPLIIGIDGAGVRQDTGEEVLIQPSLDWGPDPAAPGPGWHILGDRVSGTYAELVKVPAANVLAKPAGLSFEHAAALPTAGLTAYRALFTRGQLQRGQRVVVLGAGSGISTCAVMLAAAAGADVLVTSSSSEKLARSASLGGQGGVLYTDPGWPEQIRGLTGGGADLVIDAVGRDLAASLRCLRPGGRLVIFGAPVGQVAELDVRSFYFSQCSILGTTLGNGEEFAGLLRCVMASGWRPVIDSSFELSRVSQAHERMEAQQHYGKILLTFD